MIDSGGGAAAHTGNQCIAHAGHVTGDGWSVQANLMRSDAVIPAMAEAMQSGTGSVPERLLGALEAAESAGGDIRGSQSAALLVTSGGSIPAIRLQIEDHPDPIAELRRLTEIRVMYDDMEEGDAALGAGDQPAAAAAYDRAGSSPHAHAEILFWQAHGLAAVGDGARAVDVMRTALADNPDLAALLDRLPDVGLMDRAVADLLRSATEAL
jgi:uncharacterized Ntn-hydrolase superfamily protein